MSDTKRRDEIVHELETWYFGCPFAEWPHKTGAGEWRDITNEACRRVAELEAELAALPKHERQAGRLLTAVTQENKRLREVARLAREFMELSINPVDNGVGELEARARLFHFLSQGERP